MHIRSNPNCSTDMRKSTPKRWRRPARKNLNVEREAVEKVQKNIEKRIEYLQGQINHCEKMIKFNSGFSQEPSSNSSSSSDSSSSLSLSYSSSSSSSSDSTTSETSPSSSSASPMDLISLVSPVSSSLSDGTTSEEVSTAGDTSQEGSDSSSLY